MIEMLSQSGQKQQRANDFKTCSELLLDIKRTYSSYVTTDPKLLFRVKSVVGWVNSSHAKRKNTSLSSQGNSVRILDAHVVWPSLGVWKRQSRKTVLYLWEKSGVLFSAKYETMQRVAGRQDRWEKYTHLLYSPGKRFGSKKRWHKFSLRPKIKLLKENGFMSKSQKSQKECIFYLY